MSTHNFEGRFRFARICAIIQSIFFFLMIVAFALDQIAGQWQALLAILYVPILFFTGLLCLVASLPLTREQAYKGWAYSFIIFSALTFTFFTSMPLARILSYPFVQADQYAGVYKNELIQSRENETKVRLYKKLLKEFMYPQRIIAVKHGYVLLESNKAINLLYPCNYGLSSTRERRIEDYVNKNIIEQNRLVQIRLPKIEEFIKGYRLNWTFRMFDSQDMKVGYIPALVYLDGKLVNFIFVDAYDTDIIAELGKYNS